ncbi:MAG TPA: PASTA domain-containing protein [Arenibacter sp.]|nr:PASTA domain-containing protein [Arenibacter sp.]
MRNFFNFLTSSTFLKQLLLAVVAIGLIIFAALQWLSASTNHGQFIVVPDLAGLSVMETRTLIDDSKLRYEVLDSANYNPSFPRFSIIDQTPLAGSKVKENRKIYITVNPSGYKKVTIPNIIQVTQRNASSMLKAVGLEVERVTYVDELGKDMVYHIKYKGKYVSPGDKLPKTSKLELVCGNGDISSRAQIKADSE